MAEGAAAAFYGVESLVEGAVALAKGIYDPTLPLKATLTPITDLHYPLANHTLAVIKGRAYVIDGKTVSPGSSNDWPSDHSDVHAIILPSSGVEGFDLAKIKTRGEAPSRRYGHSSAVVDDRIYVYGGSEKEGGEPLDEEGKVWVYDTVTNSWSHLDPASHSKRPEARTQHASVASEHPQQVRQRTDEGVAPQLPMDPAKVVPEPPAADSYGTLIVHGGKGRSGQLDDIWAFDIASRTWSELPSPPPPHGAAPSLAIVEKRLYCFSTGQTSYLDLIQGSFSDKAGHGDLGLTPLGPWSTIPPVPPLSNQPGIKHPGDRTGASLIPVTTGQGRNYLLLIGGQSSSGEVLEDIWSLQLRPEGNIAASLKDSARTFISKETREMQWEEVKYHNSEGVIIQEGQAGRGVGSRKGFAAVRGAEVDGASVMVWGGVGVDGKIRGDGVMVTVNR